MSDGTITDADRAELERLAKLDNRVGARARVALALGAGAAPTAVAARLGVTFTTVRAVRRRLEHGGVAALKERYAPGGKPAPAAPAPPPPRFQAPVPGVLLERNPSAPRRGPAPTAHLAVEVWVRDAAALGLFAPGARLPDARWFVRRFGTTPRVVVRAFAALAGQGWLRVAPRQGVFLAERLPCAGRYLMLLKAPEREAPEEGLDVALTRAAREQGRRRGVEWTLREAVPTTAPEYPGLLAAIAEQSWAGVFVRTDPRIPGKREWRGGYSFLDRVPIAGFLAPGMRLGSHAACLQNPAGGGDAVDELLRAARGAGARRALVLAVARREGGVAPGEADARRRARDAGVEIPANCFVPCSAALVAQMDALLGLALRVAEDERCDAILALQDNFVEPLDRALTARYGARAAARRYRLFAWGSSPITQRPGLRFVWRGHDLAATLDSFVDWCAAVHAGANPPPPTLAPYASE